MKCQMEDCNNEANEECFMTDGETMQEITTCEQCYKEVWGNEN